jgi:hypothetical protein
MADAADVACLHQVSELAGDHDAEWRCLDCGRVFATLAGGATIAADRVEAWAARVGVPDLIVRRFLRRRGEAAAEVSA